jgi:molecular chaperone DnaK (HSP70)
VRFGAERATIELTREKFDELTCGWLERSLNLTDELLATAREKGYGNPDKLLLVGGSTYMPQVINAVKAKYPFEVRQFDPNQAVAKGAAIFGFKCYLDEQIKIRIAEQLGEPAAAVDVGDVADELRVQAEKQVALDHGLALPGLQKLARQKIQNVTSKSFGIVVMDPAVDDERVNNLIVVDEAVPKSISKQFGTYRDDQEGVSIRCMENIERAGPGDPPLGLETSSEIGSAELRFTRALPKASPIEITFALGEDGLLTVQGKDLTTHQHIAAEFRTSAVLSQEEVEKKKIRNMAITVS